MELNLETKQQLEKLLATPVLVTEEHIPLLQNLIKTYPYYQPLYLLLAKAGFDTENRANFLAKAALYTNGNILHQMIHEPQKLRPLRDVEIIEYQPWIVNHNVELENADVSDQDFTIETTEVEPVNCEETNPLATQTHSFFEETHPPIKAVIETIADEDDEIDKNDEEQVVDKKSAIAEAPEIENLEPLPHEVLSYPAEPRTSEAFELEPLAENLEEVVAEEEVSEIKSPQVEQSTIDVAENPTAVEEPLPIMAEILAKQSKAPFVLPEIENLAPLASELIKIGIVSDPSTFENVSNHVTQTLPTDQEESEITATLTPTNLSEEVEAISETRRQPADFTEIQIEDPVNSEATQQDESILVDSENKIEALTIENIAASDFFAFENNFTSEKVDEAHKATDHATVSGNDNTYEHSETVISKYDDDKLPFSFLWWLSKTRKNHEQIFRPFVSPAKSSSPTAALQQQYVENIFHLQSPLTESADQEVFNSHSKTSSKENELVENFIKNDPQLKVPKPDQINNDNKAKKSAEDNYDVVSETLAQIYIEQVLYHKAIDTYQKLSLKFPEKSRYFADLILSLEKKI